MRLQTKVLLSLGGSLLLTGLLVASYFGNRMGETMVASSKADLNAQLQVLTELMDGYRLQTERLANDHFSVLSQALAGSWSLSPETPTLTAGKSLPTLKLNGKAVNNDYALADRFTQSLGSVATIFVRSDNDFARVTTSLKNDEGQRAVGTLLDREHPAYKALLDGKPYLGRARLFGRDFMTRYEAVVDAHGNVVGALFIGVDFTQSFSALKASIQKMRIGKEGYFFAIDNSPGKARGTAMIHPEAEGKNIFQLSGENGPAATALEGAANAREGFIDFSWNANDRYAAFRSYAPWKIQLFATVAQNEILQPARQAALHLGLIMMLSLAAITVFAVWLVNRLVIQPLGGEPGEAAAAVRRIALGDLTASFQLKTGDTCSLMYSLNSMRDKLTAIVSDIREISDAAATRGDFSAKISLDGKAGFMAELAVLLNKLSSVTETGLHDISHVAQALARGDLSQKITQDYPGLFGRTTSSVNQTVEALSCIVAEIRDMVAAAKDGNFAMKLQLAGKEGYTKDLSHLLNQLSDTTEEGLQEIRRVAQALAVGDLSQTVTREFPGIFGQTTTSVNQTVDALSRTVEEIRSIVAAASEGNFGVKMSVAGKQGYTKDLSLLLNQLSDVTEDGLKEIRRVAAALATGDLTQRVSRTYPGIFGETTDGMNSTVANLSQLIDGVQQTVRAISLAAQELASGNRDLSARTEEQASSLEETASSMEELNQAVKQNLGNAHRANELAKASNTMASKGGAMVERVFDTMSEIQESSKKIAEILTLIDGIAFQTNILALNAAVEAARAGEQGKGFAVVAAEVRNLAQRSATASKEIKTLIGVSVEKIACGAQQVEEAGNTMHEVVTSFQAVSTLIEGINLASVEQGSGIEQVAEAVSQMDEVTQQNAALVEQASAATESLEAQAKGLLQAVAMFRLNKHGAHN